MITMGAETSKSFQKRVRLGHFGKYLNGKGIDIGSGNDPLVVSDGAVMHFDKIDGNAQVLEGIESQSFDFVYSSHCLEHLDSVQLALSNWIRVLKPGGYLYITVPDFSLYEKGRFPSQFNRDHKHTFSMTVTRAAQERSTHWHIPTDFNQTLVQLGMEVIESVLEDDNFDYSLDETIDQSHFPKTLVQILVVARKRLDTQRMKLSKAPEALGIARQPHSQLVLNEASEALSTCVTRERLRIYTGILGQIGDIIMFTATARRLKEIFPKSQITFAVSNRYREAGDLIKGLPYIDRVFVTKYYFERLNGIRELWRQGWPMDLRGDDEVEEQRNHDLVFETRPQRHTSREWWRSSHQVEEFSKIVGIPGPIDLRTEIRIPEGVKAPIDARGRLVLHNDPAISPDKAWPWEHLREFVRRMLPTECILLGNPGSAVPGALDFRGKTSLAEAAAIIRDSMCFVGIDSGLMWIAGSIQASTVGLYGTAYISAYEAIQPINPNASYLQAEGSLEKISPDTVRERVKCIVSERSGTGSVAG